MGSRLLQLLTALFPAWVLAGAVLALVHPPLFTWFHGSALVAGLAFIMLGMGLTLTVEDFGRALRMPRAVAAGFAAQYAIMPALGFGIAHLSGLEPGLAAGLILVACCPGGTASNVVTYLARANVALSVVMTTTSTFGAVVMTPLLASQLAGTLVEVDGLGILRSTVQVVLAPVLGGLLLRRFFPRSVQAVLPVAPLASGLVVALVCSSIVGQNAEVIRQSGAVLVGSVLALHVAGFALGHTFARLLGYDELVRRTVSIEVGMQNSGLGVVLAQRHFPGTAASVPAAISSVIHSVVGSVLAGIWRYSPPATTSRPEQEAAAPIAGG